MKLEIEKLTVSAQGTPTTAITSHKGEEIRWNVALFDKTSYEGDFDIFEQINGYWASLPMPQQDAIFDVYKRTYYDAFGALWDTSDLTMALYKLVAELYTLMPLEQVKHWLEFHGNLVIPSSLKESYQAAPEKSSTRERTYTVEDYRWLLALAVAVRAMVPVWGEFIKRTQREKGTSYKELYAYELLARSNLENSPAMEKIKIFVKGSLPQDKSFAPANYDGLSSEDVPTWMLGMVLVRRLTVGDVRGLDPNSHLVTFMYKYIDQKAKGHDTSFIGQVRDKLVDGSSQDGENNLSKLEGYKIKQAIPAGDTSIISFCMEDPYRVARCVKPDIDLQLVEQSLEAVKVLSEHQIWPPQITMTQWLLKPAIPPRGILHLKTVSESGEFQHKELTLRAIAVAQALLWHRKHYQLAALISAIEQDSSDAQQLAGSESRARVTAAQLIELERLFPFSRRAPGKSRSMDKTTAGKAPRKNTAGSDSVDSVSNSLSEHAWRLTLPTDWVAQVTGNKNDRRYYVPHNIKVLLADLAIQTAQRSF